MLSEIGLLVDKEWLKSFDIRLELFCDSYVIMPNHIHAILRINNLASNDMSKDLDPNGRRVFLHGRPVKTHGRASLPSTTLSLPLAASALPSLSLPNSIKSVGNITESFRQNFSSTDKSMNQVMPLQISEFELINLPSCSGVAFRPPKSISSFIAGFKSAVTLNARRINSGFAWQTRFHDHIIRNDHEYFAIAFYIKNNPANWDKDELFKL